MAKLTMRRKAAAAATITPTGTAKGSRARRLAPGRARYLVSFAERCPLVELDKPSAVEQAIEHSAGLQAGRRERVPIDLGECLADERKELVVVQLIGHLKASQGLSFSTCSCREGGEALHATLETEQLRGRTAPDISTLAPRWRCSRTRHQAAPR